MFPQRRRHVPKDGAFAINHHELLFICGGCSHYFSNTANVSLHLSKWSLELVLISTFRMWHMKLMLNRFLFLRKTEFCPHTEQFKALSLPSQLLCLMATWQPLVQFSSFILQITGEQKDAWKRCLSLSTFISVNRFTITRKSLFQRLSIRFSALPLSHSLFLFLFLSLHLCLFFSLPRSRPPSISRWYHLRQVVRLFSARKVFTKQQF